MKGKKLISLIIVGAMCLGLTACGGKELAFNVQGKKINLLDSQRDIAKSLVKQGIECYANVGANYFAIDKNGDIDSEKKAISFLKPDMIPEFFITLYGSALSKRLNYSNYEKDDLEGISMHTIEICDKTENEGYYAENFDLLPYMKPLFIDSEEPNGIDLGNGDTLLQQDYDDYRTFDADLKSLLVKKGIFPGVNDSSMSVIYFDDQRIDGAAYYDQAQKWVDLVHNFYVNHEDTFPQEVQYLYLFGEPNDIQDLAADCILKDGIDKIQNGKISQVTIIPYKCDYTDSDNPKCRIREIIIISKEESYSDERMRLLMEEREKNKAK